MTNSAASLEVLGESEYLSLSKFAFVAWSWNLQQWVPTIEF